MPAEQPHPRLVVHGSMQIAQIGPSSAFSRLDGQSSVDAARFRFIAGMTGARAWSGDGSVSIFRIEVKFGDLTKNRTR